MAKKGINLFGTPEGEKLLKRHIRRHPEAAGRHLDVLAEDKKKKLLEDAAREKFRSQNRTRRGLSKKLRFEILRRDNYTCRYCGKKAGATQLEVDHVKPVSKGGTDDPWNLVTACKDCNRGKSNRY